MRNLNFKKLAIGLLATALGVGSLSMTLNRTSAKNETPESPAAAFTAGNLAVYRVGNGTDALVNTGSPVFIDEYSPTGTLVQSIPLPTTVSGANKQLIASGTATAEGLITRSSDGRFLLLTGYARNLGEVGTVTATTADVVNRVIGRVDATGAVNTTTGLTETFSANSIRSAVSTNGTDFWTSGGIGGIRYTTFGGTASIQVNTGLNAVTNTRHLNIFGNQLYFSSGSGTNPRIVAIGTGTPTSTGQDSTPLPGISGTASYYGFFFADLSAAVAGVDTAYICDDTTGAGGTAISKFSLVGGTWVANGTVGAIVDSYRGLTGTVSGTTVSLYATRKGGTAATGGGELVRLNDASGYNGTLTGDPTLLATAATNMAFRGVAPVPSSGTVLTPRKAPVDYNGDGKTDYSITRTQAGVNIWYNLNNGTNSALTYQWGVPTDRLVPADYDGDNKTDLAVWRGGAAGTAAFYILNSATNTARVEAFGQTGDDPTVVGDFNGDNRADLATYRQGTQGFFYYRTMANGAVTYLPWGTTNDKPLVGDYDGDGITDVAVMRLTTPATTIIRRSSTNTAEFVNWGQYVEFTIPGDFDNDGKTDICTTSVSGANRIYYVLTRTGAIQVFQFGLATDAIVPGDYDGDGATDIAVWRNGVFYVRQSTNGATGVFNWGASGDTPVANYSVRVSPVR